MNGGIWWLMLGAGAITFAIRFSFIAAEGLYTPPSWLRVALGFVPVVALTALTVPELLLVDGSVALTDNPRLLAGIVAVVVAARWRNVLLSIGVGYAVLMLLKFFSTY